MRLVIALELADATYGCVHPSPRLELLQHDVELASESARAARAITFTASQQASHLGLFDSAAGSPDARYRRLHAAPLGGR